MENSIVFFIGTLLSHWPSDAGGETDFLQSQYLLQLHKSWIDSELGSSG